VKIHQNQLGDKPRGKKPKEDIFNMETDAVGLQNAIAKGVHKLLLLNPGHLYSVREIVIEESVSGNTQQIIKSLDLLLKQRLVKVKKRGNGLCYQVVSEPIK